MLYLLFDLAIHDEYTKHILTIHFPEYESLFKGTDDEDLMDTAPYLFSIQSDWKEKLANEKLISLKEYLIIESDSTLSNLRIHFQQFIYQKVKGKLFYFRIWDGNVLEKFLPTCTLEQLRIFYKQIESLQFENLVECRGVQFNVENGKVKLSIQELKTSFNFDENIETLATIKNNKPDLIETKKKTRNWNV